MRIKTPIFSIITVTKNNCGGLAKTATSITNQQRIDGFEWIIIDGASTDGTLAQLDTLSAHSLSEPDDGLYDAMNKGIALATGEYIMFLNAGDQLARVDTLQAIIETLMALGPDFVYGDALEDTAYGQFMKPAKPYTRYPYGMFTHHQSMIYKRALLQGLRYDQNYQIAADYDLTCRVLKHANDVHYMPVPLCIFESGGLSQQNAHIGRREQFEIRQHLKLLPRWRSALLYGQQSLGWAFRSFCPALFWHLRKRGQPSGNTACVTSQI